MPADPQGKQQHVVETLNLVDSGTSVLLDAQVRKDFSAEVALEALVFEFGPKVLDKLVVLAIK